MEKYLNKTFGVKGKTVIVTGAAGQLGSEYVRAFLNAGAKVAGFDLDLSSPVGKLNRIKSKRFVGIKCDITDKKSIKDALAKTIKTIGHPNVLINNAAIDAPPKANGRDTGLFEHYPQESWDKMMEVNLKGMFLCCQIIGANMAKHKDGSIINISSIYGMNSPDQRIYKYKKETFVKPITYGVSKAGVLNFSKYLSTYWAKKNVRVNSLTLAGVFNGQDKKFLKNYTQKVPLGRMANRDEYNGAVLFLASDASSYMTGSNLIIDGGYSAW